MSRQFKPGSKPHRAQVRARLVALGAPEATIAAHVAKHLITECQIRPRTAWRLASELSLDQVAHQYNIITGNPRAGMRGSRIWEYEQWPERGVRPTLQALRILAQVYGTTWRSLLGLRELEHLPPEDLAEYHAVGGAPATMSPAASVRQPSGDRNAAPILVDVGMNALAEAMTLTKTNVDDTQLDDLWSDVSYLGNAYARSSPESVLCQLSVVRELAAALLKGRQRPNQARDLYLISAKCCAMTAWISADLGRYGPAHELNAAAWLYTQYADDHLARRWVRTSQARVEYWAGDGVESAQLAVDGLKYKVGPQLADTPLLLAEARGWSSVRAEHQVLDAIGRWSRTCDSDPVVPREDRFFNITKDRQHYVAGQSLLSVGHTGRALEEFRIARQLYEGLAPEYQWKAMEPMIRIDTGRAYLKLGELEAAAAEIEPFLSTEISRQPDMVRAMLRVLTAELSDPRWRTSKTAQGMVDAFKGQENVHTAVK